MATTECRKCGASVVPFAEFCPHCGVERPTDDFLGRTLGGNIVIESLIGSGAMGDVYRGLQTNIDRAVAVKVLNNVSVNDERIVSFFMREAKVLSKLRHPNLVAVVDFGREPDGTLFLVMEFVPGRPLERIIADEAPFAPRRACRIVVQILRALEEVHGHQIVHCDLKPDNVLIEEVAGFEDFVKVVDFGVATLLDGERSRAGTGASEGRDVYGTPQYMSPEQAMGQQLDGRTDVYATAVLLYQMVTATKPHAGNDLLDLLVQKVSADPEPPSKRAPKLAIPPEIDALCSKGMWRDRDGRFASAKAFRVAVEEVLDAFRSPSRSLTPLVSLANDDEESTAPLASLPFSGEALPDSTDSSVSGDRLRQMAVMAVRPMVNRSAETGAQTEAARQEGIWRLISSVSERFGGQVQASEDGLSLVMFEERPGVPSVVNASRAALSLRETAVKTMAYARLAIAVFRGSVIEAEARSGELGSERRPSGEAVVNVTALASKAKGHQILVGGGSAELLSNLFVTARHGDALELIDHRGGGATSALSVVMPALGQQTMAAARGFVNRDAERARIEHLLECVGVGKAGGPLLILGPDGIGKTALAKYLRSRARTLGLPVLESYCHNRLLDRPFRPLLDLAIQAAGLDVAASAIDAEALREGLILVGLSEMDTAVIVGQFFAGEPASADNVQPLTYEGLASELHRFSRADRRHIFTVALRNLIRHVAGSGGVVLILEDLQLSDVGTIGCLPSLCELVRELPVVLLATSTTDKSAGLRGFETTELTPMTGLDLEHFWAELNEQAPGGSGQDRDREVLEASGGVPLYLSRWVQRPLQGEVPASVSALIEAQIDLLPGRLRQLILLTAVIGDYFERTVAEGLFPASSSIGPALDGAMASKVLEPCPGQEELWRFGHGAIRRTVYQNLTTEDRARYHKSVYDGLAATGATRSSRHLLLLATHADRAALGIETFDSAELLADCFTVAGDPAVGEYWYARALTGAQRAMKDGVPLPGSRLNDLILKAAETFLRAGHASRAAALLSQLTSAAQPEHKVYRAMLMARIHRALGETAAALKAVGQPTRDDHLSLPVSVGKTALAAELHIQLGNTAEALRTLEDLADDLATNVVAIPESMAHLRYTTLRVYGEAAVNSGDNERGEAALRDGFILARRAGDGPSLLRSLAAIAQYLLRDGRPEELLALCDDALTSSEISLRLPQRLAVYRIMHDAHRAMYDQRAATKDLRKARVIAEELGWREMVAQLNALLGTSG